MAGQVDKSARARPFEVVRSRLEAKPRPLPRYGRFHLTLEQVCKNAIHSRSWF